MSRRRKPRPASVAVQEDFEPIVIENTEEAQLVEGKDQVDLDDLVDDMSIPTPSLSVTLAEAIRYVLADADDRYYSSSELTDMLILGGYREGPKEKLAPQVSSTLFKMREKNPSWMEFKRDGRRFLYRFIDGTIEVF